MAKRTRKSKALTKLRPSDFFPDTAMSGNTDFLQPMTSHARASVDRAADLQKRCDELWHDRHFLLTILRFYGFPNNSLTQEANEAFTIIAQDDAAGTLSYEK